MNSAFSSRSPPLEGGGPSTYAALYFEIYTPPLEGIQLMSIAGYEAFVLCVSLCIKHVPVVTRVCVYTARNNYFIQKFNYTVPKQERKTFKNE